MTCDVVKVPGGGTAIVCSRGRRPQRKPCVGCRTLSDRLCDGCDKPVCEACSVSATPDDDFCPCCFLAAWRHWLELSPDNRDLDEAREARRARFRGWVVANPEDFEALVTRSPEGRGETPPPKPKKAGLFWTAPDGLSRVLLYENRGTVKNALVWESRGPRSRRFTELGFISLGDTYKALQHGVQLFLNPPPGSMQRRNPPSPARWVSHETLRQVLVAHDAYLVAGGQPRPWAKTLEERVAAAQADRASARAARAEGAAL